MDGSGLHAPTRTPTTTDKPPIGSPLQPRYVRSIGTPSTADHEQSVIFLPLQCHFLSIMSIIVIADTP